MRSLRIGLRLGSSVGLNSPTLCDAIPLPTRTLPHRIPATDPDSSNPRRCSMAFFPEVQKIRYEGPDATNPLAFRHYNVDEVVAGKSMRDDLRFAVCYWHTFRNMGGDPFGPGCAVRPWEDGSDSLEMA